MKKTTEFGTLHDLPLLTQAEWPGGEAESKEMVAVAGRILDPEGIWIDRSGDLACFFVRSRFRKRAPSAP